jgi:hypothetical protein
MSVRVKSWKSVYMTSHRAFLTVLALDILFRIFHSTILVTFGIVVTTNSSLTNTTSTVVICFGTSAFPSTTVMTIWGLVSVLINKKKETIFKKEINKVI